MELYITPIQSHLSSSLIHCPSCKVGQLYRSRRKGFMEETVYAWFGLFPWRCAKCRLRVRRKSRDS